MLFDGLIRAFPCALELLIRDGTGGGCASGLGFAQPFGDRAFGGAIVERLGVEIGPGIECLRGASPRYGWAAAIGAIGVGKAAREFLQACAFFGRCVLEQLLGTVSHAPRGFALLLGVLALVGQFAKLTGELLRAAGRAGIGAWIGVSVLCRARLILWRGLLTRGLRTRRPRLLTRFAAGAPLIRLRCGRG